MFFEEFHFSGDVAAVELGGYVFAEGLDGFAGDDLAADADLQGDLELVLGDGAAELDEQAAAAFFGLGAVDDEAEGIDGGAVDEEVDFGEVALLEAEELIVHGRIAAADALEDVVEVVDDLGQRGAVFHHDAGGAEVLGFDELAAAVLGEFHDAADGFGGGDDLELDDGFADLGDLLHIRQFAGRVDAFGLAGGGEDLVADGRGGLEDVDIVFAFEAFLDDLHVQQAEKAAAEAEAQGRGILRDEAEAGIVERQFIEGGPELGVVGGAAGIEVREDHLHGLLVAGQRLVGGVGIIGDGVADGDVGEFFDVGDDIADLAGADLLDGCGIGGKFAEVGNHVRLAGTHEADLLAPGELALKDAHVGNDAAVFVRMAVVDQCGRRPVGLVFRRGQFGDDGLQERIDAFAGFGAEGETFFGGDADDLFDFFDDAVGLGGGQVDLVDDAEDLAAGLDGQVGVGDGLGLDALTGIDNQQSPFARGQRPGDFVVEVDVAGRVDEVEHVGFALVGVVHGDGGGFDGDAPLAFKIHIVQKLGFHVAFSDRTGSFHDAVGQGAFAVVNVGDN